MKDVQQFANPKLIWHTVINNQGSSDSQENYSRTSSATLYPLPSPDLPVRSINYF